MGKSTTCDVLIYVPSFDGGGAERVFVRLANFYTSQGTKVTFVVNKAGGPIQQTLSPEVNVLETGVRQSLRAVPRLVKILRQERPTAVFSALTSANIAMVAAARLAGLTGAPTRVMVCERNEYTASSKRFSPKKRFLFSTLIRLTYPFADKISGNASGVVEDLKRYVKFSGRKFCLIPNPAPDSAQVEIAKTAAPPHPWFTENTPVAVAMARLVPQKDYPTMLRAVAECPMPLRLIVLGQGDQRPELEAMAADLGIQDRVDFAGFRMNRFDYLAHSNVFLLSSLSEGFPNALIEALSFGLPCVSTDCAGGGPRDVLGEPFPQMLVPMQDSHAMANAMTQQLSHPPTSERIAAVVERFSIDTISDQFLREIRA